MKDGQRVVSFPREVVVVADADHVQRVCLRLADLLHGSFLPDNSIWHVQESDAR